MIYNVKRIYICLSDIFKLFQVFSREIQAIIRPHTDSHTFLRFTTKCHIKRKKEARHKSLGNYGPCDAITNKVLSFAFGVSAATKLIDTQKALAKIRSRALPTVFLPRAFYKKSALSQLSKRAECLLPPPKKSIGKITIFYYYSKSENTGIFPLSQHNFDALIYANRFGEHQR